MANGNQQPIDTSVFGAPEGLKANRAFIDAALAEAGKQGINTQFLEPEGLLGASVGDVRKRIGLKIPKPPAPPTPIAPPTPPTPLSTPTPPPPGTDEIKKTTDEAAKVEEPTVEQQLKDLSDEGNVLDRQVIEQLDAFSKTLSDRSKAEIENIKATFARRREAQNRINQSTLSAQKIIGARSGRQRFATEIQTSILSAEESAGLSRMAELDAQEQQLIREAEQAREDKEFAILSQKMQLRRDTLARKEKLVLDLNKLAQEKEKIANEKLKQAREDARFSLEVAKFEQESEIALSEITGSFRGSPTFAAEQAALKNLLDIAGLTGEFNGEPTLAGKKAILDEAVNIANLTGVFQGEPTLEAKQFDLDISRFEELIRSNKAQEALRGMANAISAGNLALSQAKFTAEQAEKIIAGSSIKAAIDALPVGQQEGAFSAIASFQNAQDIINLLDAGVQTGPIAGRGLTGIGIPIPFTDAELPIFAGRQATGKSTENENKLLAAMTAFSANFIKSISGVQVSDEERKQLMNALPGINRQEQVNRDSLDALLKTLKNKYELQLGIKLDTVIPKKKGDIVNVGGKDVKVGSIIENNQGKKARVESDGTLTLISD